MSLQGSSLKQTVGAELAPTHDLAAAPAAGRVPVRAWLFAVAGLIFVMVLVGGATRLTESGLSITQWKPVTGVIPPLNEADWREEFQRYQQIPQFARLNSDMTLEGFKTIFWWEWSHRLLARIIGAAFIAAGAVVLGARPARGRARAAGGGRDRTARAGADRRLVDGFLGPFRADRGRAGAAGDPSPDRGRDVRRADPCRRRHGRRASGEGRRGLRRRVRRASRCWCSFNSALARSSRACARARSTTPGR